MELATIEETYITTSEIAGECGVDVPTVHNWLKYFRYMESEVKLGRRVVQREEFEKFKAAHPELVKQAA